MSTPFFLIPFSVAALPLFRLTPEFIRAGASPRSEGAETRADVPGGRVRWVVGRIARNPQSPKGGIPDGEEGKEGEEGCEEEIATASSP